MTFVSVDVCVLFIHHLALPFVIKTTEYKRLEIAQTALNITSVIDKDLECLMILALIRIVPLDNELSRERQYVWTLFRATALLSEG